MPYPVTYSVTYSYIGFQQAQQGVSAFPGTQLDADMAGLQASVSSLALFMTGVLRSDGALNNGVVTYDSLSASLQTAGLAPAAAWLTATPYAANVAAITNGNLYRSTVAHTSGVFATDLAAGKWTFVTTFPIPPPTATTLGGIKSIIPAASKWISSIGTDGTPAQTQPAFADISGGAAIAQGGTGQATAAAAFDALAPTTTRGDLVVRGASSNSRLGLGASGFHVQSNGTDLVWAGFLQAGTGAVARTWNAKAADVFSVADFGILFTANDSTIFQAAINACSAAGGGTVLVPSGTFRVGGLTVPDFVTIRGTGKSSTYLQSWYVDATVITVSGTKGGLVDLTVYGKGVNSDTGTLGATNPAVVISGVENVIKNVLVWGGSYPIFATGVDNHFQDVNSSYGYNSANIVITGANWFIRCKFDHGTTTVAPTDTIPFAAWAATTAYTPGKVRITGGYALCCKLGGTSGGSAPTVKNYGLAITDGTVTWEMLAPSAFFGVLLGNGAGENHFFQCDISGSGYTRALSVQAASGGVGPAVTVVTDSIFSAPVDITTGLLTILRGNELGGAININGTYTGKTIIDGNSAFGNATNITVAANVNDFIIADNFLVGGTITVTAGTSDRYRITNNPNCTVADSGTGTDKTVISKSVAITPAGIGYATGAGGTVTQATSKATGVTLNKASGAITLNAAALAAATIVSFVLTDSAIAATDVLILNHISGGTPGSYSLNARCAAGSATIDVRNNSAGSLSEAIVIQFALIKGVNA